MTTKTGQRLFALTPSCRLVWLVLVAFCGGIAKTGAKQGSSASGQRNFRLSAAGKIASATNEDSSVLIKKYNCDGGVWGQRDVANLSISVRKFEKFRGSEMYECDMWQLYEFRPSIPHAHYLLYIGIS